MYFTKKRSIEILLWICFLSISATINATSIIMETMRAGDEIAAWKPFLWEFSSVLFILLLIPCLLYIDQRMPIAGKGWPKRLLIHIPFSMIYSLIHISGMIALRKGIYALAGQSYKYGDIDFELLYEYRKDFSSYILIMLVIYAYREIVRLRNGEAQLSKSRDNSEDHQEDDRILVSKSGHFHFIDPSAILWVEAAGNYVELHVGPETYMLRATMKEIENRLGNDAFARIHRSTIVKRDQVDRVMPVMNGDKILKLKNNQEFRLSRRYRQNFDDGQKRVLF